MEKNTHKLKGVQPAKRTIYSIHNSKIVRTCRSGGVSSWMHKVQSRTGIKETQQQQWSIFVERTTDIVANNAGTKHKRGMMTPNAAYRRHTGRSLTGIGRTGCCCSSRGSLSWTRACRPGPAGSATGGSSAAGSTLLPARSRRACCG